MKFATLLTPSSVYMSRTPFSKIPHGPNNPKGNGTMVKYVEKFYRRHTALIPAAVDKINVKKSAKYSARDPQASKWP